MPFLYQNFYNNQGPQLVLYICKKKMICNNPDIDLVIINAYAKFDLIPSIYSQNTEQKPNSDHIQGPQLL